MPCFCHSCNWDHVVVLRAFHTDRVKRRHCRMDQHRCSQKITADPRDNPCVGAFAPSVKKKKENSPALPQLLSLASMCTNEHVRVNFTEPRVCVFTVIVSCWSRLVPVWGDALSADPVSTAGRDWICQNLLTLWTPGRLICGKTPLSVEMKNLVYW